VGISKHVKGEGEGEGGNFKYFCHHEEKFKKYK
jgi:hypothetical protein